MGTKLINKHGKTVLVSDERVEYLLTQGFERAPVEEPAGEDDEIVAELKKRTKAQLAELAAEQGIELDPDKLSKQAMIDALVAD